jgi:hypothetical protein
MFGYLDKYYGPAAGSFEEGVVKLARWSVPKSTLVLGIAVCTWFAGRYLTFFYAQSPLASHITTETQLFINSTTVGQAVAVGLAIPLMVPIILPLICDFVAVGLAILAVIIYNVMNEKLFAKKE